MACEILPTCWELSRDLREIGVGNICLLLLSTVGQALAATLLVAVFFLYHGILARELCQEW